MLILFHVSRRFGSENWCHKQTTYQPTTVSQRADGWPSCRSSTPPGSKCFAKHTAHIPGGDIGLPTLQQRHSVPTDSSNGAHPLPFLSLAPSERSVCRYRPGLSDRGVIPAPPTWHGPYSIPRPPGTRHHARYATLAKATIDTSTSGYDQPTETFQGPCTWRLCLAIPGRSDVVDAN